MHKTARQRPLWVQATLFTIKGLLMFGVGLGLTLALVTAVLANQAALHKQFCDEVDYVAPLTEAVHAQVHQLALKLGSLTDR